MECSRVHKDLIFYIEDSLDDEKKAFIDNHLRECRSCADLAQRLRKSLEVVDAERRVEADNDFTERVIDRLRQDESKSLLLSIVRYAAAAAVIIFGVFTGINIARMASGYTQNGAAELSEEIYYLNDMYQEPIESFFLLKYEDNE